MGVKRTEINNADQFGRITFLGSEIDFLKNFETIEH